MECCKEYNAKSENDVIERTWQASIILVNDPFCKSNLKKYFVTKIKFKDARLVLF